MTLHLLSFLFLYLFPEKASKFNHGSLVPSKDWVFLRFQWRPSWMLRKKSLVESTWHAVGTGHGAMLTISASPAANFFLSLPSKDAHACPRLLKGTWTLRVTYSGSIRGRNDNECGHIGVNRIPGTCIYSNSMSNLNIKVTLMQQSTCQFNAFLGKQTEQHSKTEKFRKQEEQ